MKKQFDKTNRINAANKVTRLGLVANAFLSLTKIMAGVFGRSEAMIADGVHSLSDLVSDAVILFGFRMTNKPVDHSHDYGHGKFETLSAAFIGIFLLLVSGGLMYKGGKTVLMFLSGKSLPVPGIITLLMAIVSIGVKEILFRITLFVSQKIKSEALKANAWHHRSDMFSSLATFLGIGGAMLLGPHWAVLDPLAALIVSILIAKVAVDILKGSLKELTDASLSDTIENEILQIASSVNGAYKPHHLKTRKIGLSIAIDLDIRVGGNLTVTEGHRICTEVEQKLRQRFGEDIFVRIHMEPLNNDGHAQIKEI